MPNIPARFLKLFLIAVGVAASVSVCDAKTQTVNASASEKVIVLQQKHQWLGKVIVYCNESHVRVQSCQSDAALVANAPDWRVQIYDPQRKLIYDLTKEKFFESGYTGPFQATGLIKAKLKLLSTGKLGNMPGTHYTYQQGTRASYWTLTSSVTGIACQILQALYGCPAAPGIPLAVQKNESKKRSGTDNMIIFSEGGGAVLTTAKYETASISSKKFDYVSGYKKARFATDVLVNKKIKDDLETGISEFGLGLGNVK